MGGDVAVLVDKVDHAGVQCTVVGVERRAVRSDALERLDRPVLKQSLEDALDGPLGDVNVLGELVGGDAAEAEPKA